MRIPPVLTLSIYIYMTAKKYRLKIHIHFWNWILYQFSHQILEFVYFLRRILYGSLHLINIGSKYEIFWYFIFQVIFFSNFVRAEQKKILIGNSGRN